MIANSEFQAFIKLDLAPVKIKLMHDSGEGWSAERTTAVETEYRRFLYLTKAFPEHPHAPTDDVDTFWHYHILDTMKYAADCEQLFGYFLHHFPYAGMRGEADMETLQQVARRTAIQYERTFGVRYPGVAAEATGEGSCGIIEQAGLRLEIEPKVQGGASKRMHRLSTTKAAGASAVEAAYCFVTAPVEGKGSVQAAYCFTPAPAEGKGAVQAAYCFTQAPVEGKAAVQAAYCFTQAPVEAKAAVQAAYCFTQAPVDGQAAVQAAYCFTEAPLDGKGAVQAAYCFTEVKAADSRTGAVVYSPRFGSERFARA